MKVTVAAVPVVVGRFEIAIRDPGIVRHVAFEQKQKLVMSRGDATFEEVPVLFVEGHQDAPIRKHRYEIIPHGRWCELEDDQRATWVGSGISANGMVVHVFEISEQPS